MPVAGELLEMSYGDGPLVKIALPRGSFNLHWFSLFNAISFQIMMGAPIIVYAKSLGASSTTLGIIAAFTPLMTFFSFRRRSTSIASVTVSLS